MNILIIENGVVVNAIKSTLREAQKAYPDSIVFKSGEGAPGWTYDGKKLSPPKTPEKTKTLNAANVLQQLSEIEVSAFIDLLESNSVVSTQRATQLKTKV